MDAADVRIVFSVETRSPQAMLVTGIFSMS